MWERVCLPLLCLLHLPLFLSGENNSTTTTTITTNSTITTIVLIGTSYGGTCYYSLQVAVADFVLQCYSYTCLNQTLTLTL